MTRVEPRELATQLLRKHADPIGAGVYQLLCRLVPSYTAIEGAAVARSAAHFVRAVAKFLEDGNSAPLFALGREMVSLRKVAGFATADMIIGVQVYLPMIRRAFLASAPTEAALRAFDLVEGVMLPLQARFIQQLVPEVEDTIEEVALVAVDLDALPEFLRDTES